jgi:alkyl hydroperoxide reductase subunit D
MEELETLRARLPEFAKDTRLNLQTVLEGASLLSSSQRWGIAVASAAVSRNRELLEAVIAQARGAAGDDLVDDALAAASLMAMNNVFYRFRHMAGKATYSQKPARLRMNRLAQPRTNKTDFELFSLAASAIHGCETCIQAHERTVIEAGLSEDHVLDAVRIASVVYAAAISLELASVAGGQLPLTQENTRT